MSETSRDIRADVVVVGAGPAGLGAGVAVRSHGRSVVVVDGGRAVGLRSPSDPKELGIGVGGAGLYSDGKFSFRPAASRLWTLERADILARAESWALDLLSRYGAAVPSGSVERAVLADGVVLKNYPCIRLLFRERLALIESLVEQVGGNVLPDHQVARMSLHADAASLTCDTALQGRVAVSGQAAIIATGRFGPLRWAELAPGTHSTFVRTEFGVRIAHRPGIGPLARYGGTDVKLLYSSVTPGVEWRTFCACRAGTVLPLNVHGVTAYSGTSDVGGDDRWSFSFNVRVEPPAEPFVIRAPVSVAEPISLQVLMDAGASLVEPFYSARGAELLMDGLVRLVGEYPDLIDGSSVAYFPVIEGVGYYPAIDNGLRIPGTRVWVAGDAAGIFRGTVAALVSGWYAGACAVDAVE